MKQMHHSVLQPWVMNLGWKMQSILLSGFRGPDDAELPATKAVNRWIRRVSQNNADPSKDYMRDDKMPSDLELCEELEWRSCHYVHHLADALRVVALFHPDEKVRTRAYDYHFRIAEEIFHFEPESDEVFNVRHQDKVASDSIRVSLLPKPKLDAVPLLDASGALVGARVRIYHSSGPGLNRLDYEAWDFGNEGGHGRPVDEASK